MRDDYIVIYSFEYFGDIIHYECHRENDSLDNMIRDAQNWLHIYGYKYGVCYKVIITNNNDDILYCARKIGCDWVTRFYI